MCVLRTSLNGTSKERINMIQGVFRNETDTQDERDDGLTEPRNSTKPIEQAERVTTLTVWIGSIVGAVDRCTATSPITMEELNKSRRNTVQRTGE